MKSDEGIKFTKETAANLRRIADGLDSGEMGIQKHVDTAINAVNSCRIRLLVIRYVDKTMES